MSEFFFIVIARRMKWDEAIQIKYRRIYLTDIQRVVFQPFTMQ
jgi:hypothetical protein